MKIEGTKERGAVPLTIFCPPGTCTISGLFHMRWLKSPEFSEILLDFFRINAGSAMLLGRIAKWIRQCTKIRSKIFRGIFLRDGGQ